MPESSSTDATVPAPVPAPTGDFPPTVPQDIDAVAAIRAGHPAADATREERIPGYRFVRRLGKGGMGEVWLVEDIRRDQLVALKQILAPKAGSGERRRFATEGQAMARMDHPHVASIFHIGEHDGRPFFVMEYCPGGTLGEYLDHKPQPPALCAAVAGAVARGVAHAHRAGVVHRDLKPGNVLLSRRVSPPDASTSPATPPAPKPETASTRDADPVAFSADLLKITDFGLAKKLDDGASMTRTQAVMGTPSYMAPEQATSTRDAGPGADIWSVGVILYEMLTGGVPFVGADSEEVIDNLKHKQPVAPSEKVSVPRDLETICLKCLRKDPADRYPSADALADDLRAFSEGRGISARPMSGAERAVRWVRRNPSWAGLMSAVAVSLILGTGVSAWQAVRAGDAEAVAKRRGDEAVAEAARADRQTAVAEKRADEAENQLAISRMYLADGQYRAGQAALAREFLEKIPGRFRSWEWHYRRRQYDGSIAVLRGHSDKVTGIAVSPDGKMIASGSYDRTVVVHDAGSGRVLRVLRGHADTVSCLAFSPDGAKVVSGSRDQTVRVWDAATGRPLRELGGHTNVVTGVGFSPDGTKLLSASNDAIRVRPLSGSDEPLEIVRPMHGVTSAAFSPDGTKIVTGTWYNVVDVWDAATGKPLDQLKSPSKTYGITGVAVSPDGGRIASGDAEGFVRVRGAEGGRSLLEVRVEKPSATCVAWSPDGQRFVWGAPDGVLRVWGAKTGRGLLELRGHADAITDVAFTPDGQRVVSGSLDGTVRVWDAKTGRFALELGGATGPVSGIAWSPDGGRVATGSDDGRVRVHDRRTGRTLLELEGHMDWVAGVSWSPDGKRIASGGHDNNVRLWDADTGAAVGLLEGHAGWVRGVAFSPDGSRIASAGDDKTVRVWDAATGKPLSVLTGQDGGVYAAAWSPDGSRVAGASADKSICVWDAATGALLREIVGPTDAVTGVCWGPDGRRLASGSKDGTVCVWDAATGERLLELRGHAGAVGGVAFRPDGKRIVSGGQDGTVRVWDSFSGQSLLELQGHADRVAGVAYSPDGERIASGGLDCAIRVWACDRSPDSGEVAPDEVAYREAKSRPDPLWMRDQLAAARANRDDFAAAFWQKRLAALATPAAAKK